jgi:hypothetical protein
MKQIKYLLLYLVFANGLLGILALFFPQSFYSSFPHLGFNFHWIDSMGPFNDHFIRDVGAFFCALASLSIYTLYRFEDGTVRLTAYGNLVFSIPHLIYHIIMINMFITMMDKILGISSLAMAVIVPVLILILAGKTFHISPTAKTDSYQSFTQSRYSLSNTNNYYGNRSIQRTIQKRFGKTEI